MKKIFLLFVIFQIHLLYIVSIDILNIITIAGTRDNYDDYYDGTTYSKIKHNNENENSILNIDANSIDLLNPYGVTVDNHDNFYFSDTSNNIVYKVRLNGDISIIAGIGDHIYNGDDQPAISATLYNPYGIALDNKNENLYIADTNNNLIRKVNFNSGIITSIAGNRTIGFSGDNGQAYLATVGMPQGIRTLLILSNISI